MSIPPNPTAEVVCNLIPFQHRLQYDPLDVLRLHSTIPDATPGQRVLATVFRPHPRRQIHNDVAREYVTADVADQADARRSARRRLLGSLPRWRFAVYFHRPRVLFTPLRGLLGA